MRNTIPLPRGLHLRDYRVEDQGFAELLFSSTREHFHLLPLPKPQLELLLKQQFVLQQSSYAQSFPQADTYIIELENESVGKIILNKTSDSIHIVDLALVKQLRGQGYGTGILRSVKSFAEQQKRLLRLSVDQQNLRAKKLYLSLGFTQIGASDTHDALIWV